MARDAKLDALASTDIFASCSDKQLEAIGSATERAQLSAGDVLITQGHTSHQMAIIISGAATVTVDGTTVAEIGPGGVVGELGLIDGERASATVTASEDTDCWLVPRNGFLPVYEKNADLARPLLNAVIAKLRATDELLH